MSFVISLLRIFCVMQVLYQDKFKMVEAVERNVLINQNIRFILVPPETIRDGTEIGKDANTEKLNLDEVIIDNDERKFRKSNQQKNKTITSYEIDDMDLVSLLKIIQNLRNKIANKTVKILITDTLEKESPQSMEILKEMRPHKMIPSKSDLKKIRLEERAKLIEMRRKQITRKPKSSTRTSIGSFNIRSSSNDGVQQYYNRSTNTNTTSIKQPSPLESISRSNINSDSDIRNNSGERVDIERLSTNQNPNPSNPSIQYCGRKFKQHTTLITNGYSTKRGDWPWHAALYHIKDATVDYKCGGSLISLNAILTAAHCVYEQSNILIPERIIIRLGSDNKLRTDSKSQEFHVQQIIPHENFSMKNLKNDIAILQLRMPAVLTDYVQTVCLWQKDKSSIRESEGKQGYVIGWGINEKEENVNYLREIKMPVVSHEDCLDRHSEFFNQFLSANTFCAGFRNGTSACNGDSGGGMFFEDNAGIFRIRGMVSVSIAMENSLCDPYEYIIFTNVGRYLDWIENIIAKMV